MSDFPSEWPRVWRGESSGSQFTEFDMAKTRCGVGFFFAHRHDHANSYATPEAPARSFVLDPGRVLNLLDPYGTIKDPQVTAILNEIRRSFDDWTCRESGEDRDLLDYLEAGDLYSYEGTGSAERWNQLFNEARGAGYDSVTVRDVTDGVSGDDAVIWVVFDPSRIHFDPRPAPEPVPPPRRWRP